MNKVKRKSIILASALILGLATFTWFQTASIQPQEISTEISAESVGQMMAQEEVVADPEPLESESELIEAPLSAWRSQALGEVDAGMLRERVAAQEPLPHDVALDQYKATLWADVQANPPELPEPGKSVVDAELAYRIYMFYGNCSIAPRTEADLDMRLKQITARAENANERYLDNIERSANQIFNFYELCQTIPLEMDSRLEAIHWMSVAVQLGHEIAEVQFYDKAMGFMLRKSRFENSPPLVMLHPGLIDQFKVTARFALNRAMVKGHPEAYLAMSQAHFDGVIFSKDPVLAMAYVRAAELEAIENAIILDRLGRQKSKIFNLLDHEQLAEADEIAHRLRLGESV